jgi:signal transduction histidine kinase
MKDKLDSVGKKSAAGDFSRHIVAHIIDYIREYILGQLRESFLTVICILLLVIITDLILFTSSSLKKNISDIAYLNVFLAVVVCVFGIIGQLRFRSRYLKLRTALNKKEGIDYLLPVDSGFSASLLRDAVELKNQECFDKTGALQDNLDELNNYITKWVHEIKIPISVCELIAENITSEEKQAHRLKIELERTKFLINQVLYAGRASRYDKDLSMGEFAFSKVVSDAVKRNSAFFIQKNFDLCGRVYHNLPH